MRVNLYYNGNGVGDTLVILDSITYKLVEIIENIKMADIKFNSMGYDVRAANLYLDDDQMDSMLDSLEGGV